MSSIKDLGLSASKLNRMLATSVRPRLGRAHLTATLLALSIFDMAAHVVGSTINHGFNIPSRDMPTNQMTAFPECRSADGWDALFQALGDYKYTQSADALPSVHLSTSSECQALDAALQAASKHNIAVFAFISLRNGSDAGPNLGPPVMAKRDTPPDEWALDQAAFNLAIKAQGCSNLKGVVVGEYGMDKDLKLTSSVIAERIDAVKADLKAAGLDASCANVPVGHSDYYDSWMLDTDKKMINHVDFIVSTRFPDVESTSYNVPDLVDEFNKKHKALVALAKHDDDGTELPVMIGQLGWHMHNHNVQTDMWNNATAIEPATAIKLEQTNLQEFYTAFVCSQLLTTVSFAWVNNIFLFDDGTPAAKASTPELSPPKLKCG